MEKQPNKKLVGREKRYFDDTQDKDGREILNPLSLVASVDMKPLTIGERIARYSGPSPRELELAGYGFDDDDYDFEPSDDTPLSEYEERTVDILVRAKANHEKRIQEAADQTRLQETEKLDKLSKELEDRRKKASATPPPPPTGEEPPAAPKAKA